MALDDPVETDKLTDLLTNSLSTCTHRLSQYKCRIRIESNQEERRKQLLEEQKEKRAELFNAKRDLKHEDDSDEWSNEKLFIENQEMEWSSLQTAWHRRPAAYYHLLMFSEWLLEIPYDLSTNWFVVPCPIGKRNVVVVNYNRASCYSKRGVSVASFKTLLPHNTILDCICCPKNKVFYILDVIQWNGMTFKYCQTDFRFYWINSQMQDNPQFSVESHENEWSAVNFDRYLCTESNLSNLINRYPIFPGNDLHLDGLLFYHKETHYRSGYTPLVGWLKAFMLPEALGINVSAEFMSEKPESYSSFKQFAIDVKEKDDQRLEKKKLSQMNRRSKNRTKKMDCQDSTTKQIEEMDKEVVTSHSFYDSATSELLKKECDTNGTSEEHSEMDQ